MTGLLAAIDPVIGVVVVALITASSTIGSVLIVGKRTERKVEDTGAAIHTSLNSRVDELIALTKTIAYGEGYDAGVEQERAEQQGDDGT